VQALGVRGRHEDAAELVAAFTDGLRGRTAPVSQAALALCRAIVAQNRAEHDRAAALFGRAAEAWLVLPRPYDALLAREQRGLCLAAAGQVEAGLAELHGVFRELADLGADGDAERVVRVLRGHGVHVPRLWRHGRHGYGDQLSPRENEVVRLVADGHTNEEIARELCRSVSTVRTQLRSAMRKLGTSSRTALAAHVAVGGLRSRGA
jgi:DNA-binding CsgD family transcriptional regulator